MLSRHRRFLLAVGLLSYLCEDTIATIRTEIIKEGRNFLFECFGDADVFFTYPINRTESDEVISYTSPIEISKNRDENGTYCYRLYRPSTVFGDTGWYGCSYDPVTITRHDFFDSRIQSKYLYVESETVRFVERAIRYTLGATVGEDFVIPCRPTSPTAEVQLKKHDGHGYLEAGRHYTFDPKLGFTLHKVNKLYGGLYTCTIAPDKKLSYTVVVAQENRLPEPRIINNSGFMEVIKGETLNLKCLVTWTSLSVDYEVFWIPMHKSERMSTWFDRVPQFNGSVRKTVSLTVRAADFNDEGIYECRVKKGKYQRSARTYVLVNSHASPKVDIRGLVSHNFPTRVANIECHVEAFPKPNITWIYSKCSNYPSCDDGTFQYLKSTKESGTATSLLSTISPTPDMSGRLTCNGCNFLGCRNVTVHMNYFDRKNFGVQVTTDTVLEGDDWELICNASAEHYSDIYWSSENGRIALSDRISISRGRTQFTHTSVLRIHNVNTKDSREYMCTGRSRNDWLLSTVYHLEVKAGRAPFIIETNLSNNEIIIDVTVLDQKGIAFHCVADGIPKPSMSWFKDGVQLAVTNKEYKFLNDFQTLELEYLLEIDSGEYICRAENRLGKVEMSQRLLIKVGGVVDNRLIGLIVLIVVLAMLVVILVIYFFKMVHSERTIREQLMEALPVRFRRTADERFHQNLYVDDPTVFGPRS